MEGMSNEMKDGLKLKLGDGTRVTPRNIQERQSLGMPKAFPFINKNPRFLPNASFLLFHAQLCFSWSVFFFVCFGLLSFLNKLVGPPLSHFGMQLVCFGLEKSRKSSYLCDKKSSFLTVAYAFPCHA